MTSATSSSPGPESRPAGNYSSLCRPDEEKSCFRCCPPIRPAGYDHLSHRAILEKILLENTAVQAEGATARRMITGYSCWGLGYLDAEHRLVGCLLHPACNQGRDLRGLTGYGDKCRRELCLEARAMAELPGWQAEKILELARGLDSFEYSSPSANPVFRLLLWGSAVIGALLDLEKEGLVREDYRRRWAVLDRELSPETDGFPLERLLLTRPLADMAEPAFLQRYRETMAKFIAARRSVYSPPADNRPYVHQLDLPASFARFLRSALGRPRSSPGQARELLGDLEQTLSRL